MSFLIVFVSLLYELLSIAIIARIIFSWIGGGKGQLYLFLIDVTQPIMNIARKITPRTGMIDFSPLVALIGIGLIRNIIIYLLGG